MSTDIDPKEAIATIVINAIHLRGYCTVHLAPVNGDWRPEAMNLTEFAYWLRDAMKELDAAMGVEL